MKLLALIFCILSTGIFTSCTKEASEATAAKAFLNVSYGNNAKQKMDIYLPANHSVATTNTIIMIHGGAWSEGDKLDFAPYVDTLKRRFPAYAIANINYRLATGNSNLFPTQENDVKTAVEYYLSKKNEYGVSDKVVLLGASAGAHLALLQAYKNNAASNIKAVINFFGPSDMTDLYNNPASILASPAAIAAVVGATPSSNATLYFQSSPVNFITSVAPPTLTLQGALDPLVRPAQQLALHHKLSAAAVANAYVNYPNEYHGWVGANLVHSFNQIQAFITAHVR